MLFFPALFILFRKYGNNHIRNSSVFFIGLFFYFFIQIIRNTNTNLITHKNLLFLPLNIVMQCIIILDKKCNTFH